MTAFMKEAMIKKGIKASFGLGGITGYFVELLKEGLVERLMDVQSFDLEAVRSIGENRSISKYQLTGTPIHGTRELLSICLT